MSINLLDILLVIPILLFARRGFRKGLVVSLSSLMALLLGLYFAFFFSDFTAGQLKQYFSINEKFLGLVAFVVTFIVVIIAVNLLAKALEKIINILMLGFLDKLAGAVFGALKGALYLSILILVINIMDPNGNFIKEERREQSVLYAPVASMAPWVYSWLNLDELGFDLPEKEEVLDEVF